MPSLHGETIGFVVEDLLALPADKPVLVDWSGNTPRDVAPLLAWPEQAVFLLPATEFRHATLANPERLADGLAVRFRLAEASRSCRAAR